VWWKLLRVSFRLWTGVEQLLEFPGKVGDLSVADLCELLGVATADRDLVRQSVVTMVVVVDDIDPLP
jgi:hypothetical protein